MAKIPTLFCDQYILLQKYSFTKVRRTKTLETLSPPPLHVLDFQFQQLSSLPMAFPLHPARRAESPFSLAVLLWAAHTHVCLFGVLFYFLIFPFYFNCVCHIWENNITCITVTTWFCLPETELTHLKQCLHALVRFQTLFGLFYRNFMEKATLIPLFPNYW